MKNRIWKKYSCIIIKDSLQGPGPCNGDKMNIFWREIKAYEKSTIIWMLALSAITILFLLLYPAFTKDVESTRKLLAGIPAAYRNALGIRIENFFTIFGFYAYLFTFVLLAGAVQAMNLGVGIISKEDAGKTSDFLLSKPVTRTKVMASKLSAALAILVITNIFFTVASLIAAKAVSTGSFSLKKFLLISLTLFLVQLFFWALGAALSVIIPKIKSVIAVTLPAVFAFFIISTIGAVIGNDNVRYITPFKFYDFAYIIAHNTYEWKFMIIEAIFIIIAITASFIIYINVNST